MVVPCLWASILIDSRLRDKDLKLSLPLVTMQLDRAKRRLDRVKGEFLDVFWKYDPQSPHHSLILQFIRDNAPLHQWRSATFDIYSMAHWNRDFTDPGDVFTNLERWTIKCKQGSSLPNFISDIKSTPNLQTIDLSADYWRRDFASLTALVSHLILSIGES